MPSWNELSMPWAQLSGGTTQPPRKCAASGCREKPASHVVIEVSPTVKCKVPLCVTHTIEADQDPEFVNYVRRMYFSR